MHPTFGVTEIDVKAAPYEMKRIGWGTFEIPIEIFFRRETGRRETLKLSHYLSFEGTGKRINFTVSFDKEKLEKINI